MNQDKEEVYETEFHSENDANSDATREEENKDIYIACLNSRSINNKSIALVDLFDEMSLSACLINETWMVEDKVTLTRLDELRARGEH